jgi:hypothetical protein
VTNRSGWSSGLEVAGPGVGREEHGHRVPAAQEVVRDEEGSVGALHVVEWWWDGVGLSEVGQEPEGQQDEQGEPLPATLVVAGGGFAFSFCHGRACFGHPRFGDGAKMAGTGPAMTANPLMYRSILFQWINMRVSSAGAVGRGEAGGDQQTADDVAWWRVGVRSGTEHGRAGERGWGVGGDARLQQVMTGG